MCCIVCQRRLQQGRRLVVMLSLSPGLASSCRPTSLLSQRCATAVVVEQYYREPMSRPTSGTFGKSESESDMMQTAWVFQG